MDPKINFVLIFDTDDFVFIKMMNQNFGLLKIIKIKTNSQSEKQEKTKAETKYVVKIKNIFDNIFQEINNQKQST